MAAPKHLVLEFFLILAAVLLALCCRPWRVLDAARLQLPWLAAMALLPWGWCLQASLPGGVLLQMSGACLLVLMFGWPLAVLSLPLVAALGGWMGGVDPRSSFEALAWHGMMPATLALGVGWATRRWLPKHLLVYIMARGFLGTALALSLGSIVGLWWQGALSELVLGHWLIAWAEAVATGMLSAVLVVYRPEWLLTYSDRLYLPAGRKP